MNITINKTDDVNILIGGLIESDAITTEFEKIAKKAAKEIKVDGFRAGKVPVSVVKQMHGERLTQDAEGEALKAFVDAGIAKAEINVANMLGEPGFRKYEKNENGNIDVEVEISLRPTLNLEHYMDIVPQFEKPSVSMEDIDAKLTEIASQKASYTKIKRKRMVKDGDMVVIDFEGFIDGVAFEGGKAEKFNLKIGSGQFIPGFEEQIIGMKYEEENSVNVTFPEAYQSKDLAGKEATFEVKLHEIQEQVSVEVDDELAQNVLQDDTATLDTLKTKVEEQLASEAMGKLYHEKLKGEMVEALVEKYDFALPNNIVEQEIDAQVNRKAQEMSEEELTLYKENSDKLETLRNSVREDAQKSVKATFIVDHIAKKESVSVEDQEVSQALYYEAVMSGQDAQETMKYYEENNLLPAVKMGMIEDKLFGKMLGLES